MNRYIFTVTAGRSGQNSLTEFLDRHVPGCYVAFHAPQVRLLLGGRLAAYERRFRRRFVETHELLGRGKVLRAFVEGDQDYLETIARRRVRMIHKELKRRGATIYVDISKHFVHGLHRGFLRILPRVSIIHLVRDPLQNMRSYLNRKKVFYLDNERPDSPSNLLRLDPSDLWPGEFYLWAWCETYLRYRALAGHPKVDAAVEIRTEQLNDPESLMSFLGSLGLPHRSPEILAPMNTNAAQGYGETVVSGDDIACYRRFEARLPAEIHGRIPHLRDYDPERRAACS